MCVGSFTSTLLILFNIIHLNYPKIFAKPFKTHLHKQTKALKQSCQNTYNKIKIVPYKVSKTFSIHSTLPSIYKYIHAYIYYKYTYSIFVLYGLSFH